MLANGQVNVQSLNGGDVVTDVFTVSSADGTAATVTIAVQGLIDGYVAIIPPTPALPQEFITTVSPPQPPATGLQPTTGAESANDINIAGTDDEAPYQEPVITQQTQGSQLFTPTGGVTPPATIDNPVTVISESAPPSSSQTYTETENAPDAGSASGEEGNRSGGDTGTLNEGAPGEGAPGEGAPGEESQPLAMEALPGGAMLAAMITGNARRISWGNLLPGNEPAFDPSQTRRKVMWHQCSGRA